jgi:hypothetical protein
MKKLSLSLLIFAAIYPLFSQTASDYFPSKEGYRWEYLGANGEVTDVYTCAIVQKIEDKASGVGIIEEYLGMKISVIYEVIEDAGIKEVTRTDVFGNPIQHKNRPVILFLREAKWEEKERGDVFQCQSKKTSVAFDGKTYEDCIMTEKSIFINGRPFMVKRQYFARGIGLVYVTLQGQDGVEKPHLRLSSYKF